MLSGNYTEVEKKSSTLYRPPQVDVKLLIVIMPLVSIDKFSLLILVIITSLYTLQISQLTEECDMLVSDHAIANLN